MNLVISSVTPVLAVPEAEMTLEQLIALPEEKLAQIDIAALNLACVEGLPNTGSVDRAALLKQLDTWAAYVAYETRRHFYRFQNNPEEYNHHFGDFAMLMMAMTLQQDLNVHYNPQQINYTDDEAFQHPRDVFIPGLLAGTGGNCASMPVLYIAVGRRLGYPLKLVRARRHFFVRWEEGDKTFNIEATSPGFATAKDSEFLEGKFALEPEAASSGYYLRSLTPKQELSSFLQTRGDCLYTAGHFAEAHQAFHQSLTVDPENSAARSWLNTTEHMLHQDQARQNAIAAIHGAEAAFQKAEERRRKQPQVVIPGMPTIRMPVVTAMPPQPTSTYALPPPVEFPQFSGVSPINPSLGVAPIFGASPMDQARSVMQQHKRQANIHSPESSLPWNSHPNTMSPSQSHYVAPQMRRPAPKPTTQFIEVPVNPIPLRLHEGVSP